MGSGNSQGQPRKGYEEHIVPFTAGDGFQCNLINVRGTDPPTKGPILLVHGAGVRANIFLPPVKRTIVDELIDNGYDVWLENWRASIDLTPNEWTLDQAALYDHPAAVKTVVKQTGQTEVKAIIHCQGSTSFMMSAIAGLIPEVKTIVSNAVSLHPIIPKFSEFKIRAAIPLASHLSRYLNPQWGLDSPTVFSKFVTLFVKLTHHECDNPVCKQVSFTYGTGFPTLWSHENLNDPTHEWIKGEFADVPMRFFLQMGRCVKAGHLVAYETMKELPQNYIGQPPKTDARFAFFAGKDNLCFLPESQVESFEYFDRKRKSYHSLHVLPHYGHLDVFIGKDAAKEVFPLMLEELEKSP